MIKSRYFPDTARCLAEMPSTDDKIEIPADVYDAVADSLGAKKNFILRGAYPYEAAKIIAESNQVEALEFDTTSGEIKTSSIVGIAAEMDLAFALWNFYDSESAIERVILSRLEFGDRLPAILSDGAGRIQIQDSMNVGEDFAKAFVKASADRSSGYVKDKIQAHKALDGEVSVSVPEMPQIFHTVKDSVGDVISSLWDDIVVFGRNFTDIKDCWKGRISKKQLVKNMIVTNAGVIGTGVGFALGGVIAVAVGLPAILVFGSAFAVGYGTKLCYKKTAKDYLDRLITDNSAEMLNIFGRELPEMLRGKFLTTYETGLLMEAIRDDITKERLKDMYACGSDSARAAWARQYIERRLKDISDQRIFIEMPSFEEWIAGMRRISERLNRGEDMLAAMERQRAEALANMRAQLDTLKLKPYELGSIIRTVNDMSKTQLRAGRTIQGIQKSNRLYGEIHRQQLDERAALKDELKKFLS